MICTIDSATFILNDGGQNSKQRRENASHISQIKYRHNIREKIGD